LGVPVGSEVSVFTLQDRDETEQRPVQEVEIDHQNDYGDVDELHDGDFHELPDCLVILGVPLFYTHYLFKDGTSDDVDHDDDHRRANHHALLNGVVYSPVLAVQFFIRVSSAILELCEVRLLHPLEDLDIQ
jgi:hypothetical protein